MKDTFLIYGSTGYTGNLIVQEAIRRGLKPVLAGRNLEKLGDQAAGLGLEWRAFPLSNTAALERAAADTGLVLLVAGPYLHTAAPVVAACLKTGAHYLDITGEQGVYEYLAQHDAQAKAAGVMLGTGMGFDVVPSDCLAYYLKKQLPEADDLKLALAYRGRTAISHGTMKSAVESMPQGLRVRRKGKLAHVQPGEKSLVVDFGWGPRTCDLFTWGDVVTAYYSTGIPNIEVYMRSGRTTRRMLQLASTSQRLFGQGLSHSLLMRAVNFLPSGSSPAQRARAYAVVWAQVSASGHQHLSARLTTPEAYEFTARSAIQAVERVLKGDFKPGFQTPAMAFGEDFVLQIEGVQGEFIA